MSTAAVTMVRDEADIVGSTLRHVLTQVDYVLVADNRSVDLTREIIRCVMREHPGRVEVIDDAEPAYLQSAKMTRLARLAHEHWGVDWIVPFDADEIWTSPHGGRIADVLSAEPAGVAVAALWDHRTTDIDPADVDPIKAMGWREQERAPLHKIAVRYHPRLRIEQGNHTAHWGGHWPQPVEGLLQIRHFPYRSAEQFVRKARNGAAAYAASNLPETMGGHWRAYGRILDTEGEQALIDNVYRRWFHRTDPTQPVTVDGETLPALVYDPAL